MRLIIALLALKPAFRPEVGIVILLPISGVFTIFDYGLSAMQLHANPIPGVLRS